ncbi:MAG TPA: TolC family outer membrane protein [Gammaproteobacteria bacterium]|nr:TolC family outer membrane protein [Gammaproteobacteria bacterium]
MNTIRSLFLGLATAGLVAAAPAHSTDLWDIYQLALKNDPTFAQAEANYQAQVENKAIARAGYLPSLGFNASKSKSHSYGTSPGEIIDPVTGASLGFGQVYQSTSGDNTQYGLQLTQPIFNWAAWKALDQADASVAQAEANFTAARQDLILRTATAYFDVLNARDTLAANQATKKALSKQLEQAKEKYQVGMSAITDVQEAQAAYDQAVADEIGGQQQVITAEEELRAIIGEPVGGLLEPVPDMPLRNPDPATAKSWVDQALKQNPSLLAAQAGADMAAATVGIKRSAELPTLDLSASYGRSKQSGSFFGTQDTKQGQVMLTLNFPIFSGGGVNAQITQAQRQYDAALDQVKLVTRQTEQQARTAFLGVLTGISQVTALKQSVQSNQTSLNATETGMKVGTRTIVDVLNARQNLLKAQTGFANSRYNYLKSVLQLKQAAGILTPDDLKQLNSLMQVAAPSPDTMPQSAPPTDNTGAQG